MAETPAIQTRGLRKEYVAVVKQPGIKGTLRTLFRPERKIVEAVKGIDLTIQPGEIVGFLGPNGAGKTTTLKMLSGILLPTTGEAKVLGFTPFERRPDMLRQIALVMGNKQQLWWDLPAWDSFVVLRDLFEVPEADFKRRVDDLIDALDLKDKINTQVRKLSLGERMKCELVAALLHAPRVVFLDEPTLGLDVVSQKRIREFLADLQARDGSTLLLTSHYMQDVEALCQRVVVIDHGRVVFEGTLDRLKTLFGDHRRLRLTLGSAVSTEDLVRFGKVVSNENSTVVLEIEGKDTPRVTSAVLEHLPVLDLGIEEPDVEDVIRDLFTQGAAKREEERTGVSRETSVETPISER